MLALVRLQPPPRDRHLVRCHDVLPPHPLGIAAAAARCATPGELEAALRWRQTGTPGGAVPPLALVVPRDAEIVRRIALEALAPAALLFEDELDHGRLPEPLLETVWRMSVLAPLEERTLHARGVGLDAGERNVLRQLVRVAAAGRRVSSAARAVSMSESGLRRWLRSRGLPAPGTLLRHLRREALEMLTGAGLDLPTAGKCCGWAEAHTVRVALRRVRTG